MSFTRHRISRISVVTALATPVAVVAGVAAIMLVILVAVSGVALLRVIGAIRPATSREARLGPGNHRRGRRELDGHRRPTI